MAYVAMNKHDPQQKKKIMFLNGVCRHELEAFLQADLRRFLNGVCRHEQPDVRLQFQ